MIQASVKWDQQARFEGRASAGHPVTVDGDSKAGSSPMELVLIALCGCTAYDVVSILQKKREPFTSVEVSAQGEKAAEPPNTALSPPCCVRRRGSRTKSSWTPND